MASKVEKKFSNAYNAYLLPLVSSNVVPGMLLEADWPFLGFIGDVEFVREEGLAWDFLEGVDPAGSPTSVANVNVLEQRLSGKHSLTGALSLPQYGVEVSASFSREFASIITIKEVQALGFVDGSSKFALIEALRALPDPQRRWVADDLLVHTCYFIRSFEAEFHNKGVVSAKHVFEGGAGKVWDEIEYDWLTEEMISVEMPAAEKGQRAPLFVRGMKV